MNAITFPTITIGSKVVTIRFSLAAQLLIRRRGLDPRNLAPALDRANPDCITNMLTVFSACAAESMVDKSDPSKYNLDAAPTADYWASELHPLQFPELEAVLAISMGKVTEARRELTLVVVPPQADPAETLDTKAS